MKDIQLIENRSELGAGTRGAGLGIDAVKLASLNLESDYFKKHDSICVEDQNHLLWKDNPTPFAIHIDGIEKVYKSVSNRVEESINANKLPLILAGDHSSAGGTIVGLKKAFPNKTLGVIWIDAHGDLHSPYTSPSGNVHGMPLATALGEDNLSCQQSTPTEKGIEKWNSLKSMGGIMPKITPSDLVFFGVRDTEGPEESLAKEKGIKNFSVEECRIKGISNVVKEALQLLAHCDVLYISFDVDSMDPDLVSYGTGTPVPGGFSAEEAQEMIDRLITESKKVVCFEMVEVNPLLDNKVNKMAETAFEILEKATQKLVEYGL